MDKINLPVKGQAMFTPQPLPKKFEKDTGGNFLPALKKTLPYSWSDETTTTVLSTKADTAQAEEKLWNLRILPLFPHTRVHHLTTLRAFLMRVAC